MPLNKDVGNWIKDFMKSNAPQFKGKSKEERKDMALAAYREKYGSLNEQDDRVMNEERKLTYDDFVSMVIADMNAGAAPDEYVSDERIRKDAKYLYNRYLQGASVDDLFEATKEEYDALLDKEHELTIAYSKDKTDANWKKLSDIREKGKKLEKELEDKGLLEATKEEENEFHKELDKLVHKTFGHSSDEKKMKEEAKPDFLDIDKDGDKEESMKKAAKDKAVKKAMKKVSEIVKVKTPEEAAKVTKANPDAEVEVVSEVLTEGHNYDYEGKMAHSQLLSIAKNSRDLFQMIDSNTQLKSWVQSKLTKAEDYLDSVRTYLEGESLTSTAPAMFENETIKDETGTALSIGDVVKGGDGRIYQVIYSYSEGKPMMVPFDLKRRKPLSLRDKVYFDSDSSIPKKLNKVMDYTATKGGFMK